MLLILIMITINHKNDNDNNNNNSNNNNNNDNDNDDSNNTIVVFYIVWLPNAYCKDYVLFQYSIMKWMTYRLVEREPLCPKYNIHGIMAYVHILHTVEWRHNGRDGVSNHQPHHHCLLNRLFRCRPNKISKLRVTGRCAENSPMASKAENVSTWWRHPDVDLTLCVVLKSLFSFGIVTTEHCHIHCFGNIFPWQKTHGIEFNCYSLTRCV